MKLDRRSIRLLLVTVIAVASWLTAQLRDEEPTQPVADAVTSSGAAELARAYREKRSVHVEAAGRVAKILQDDRDGSRHQRFLVEVAPGHTVLIAHNIDLAPRVPVETGDHVRFRGDYEWNERGGVVHWTHHDPQKRHPDGWIQFDGKRFG